MAGDISLSSTASLHIALCESARHVRRNDPQKSKASNLLRSKQGLSIVRSPYSIVDAGVGSDQNRFCDRLINLDYQSAKQWHCGHGFHANPHGILVHQMLGMNK
jgi:hypothetical protein